MVHICSTPTRATVIPSVVYGTGLLGYWSRIVGGSLMWWEASETVGEFQDFILFLFYYHDHYCLVHFAS
ncbi:Bgt-20757 [Blumeria graminis f. sp. tritici]|uniref:Bgt-20757 n=2 Tax=Blumeria graminis f. sp. tritici TaxID=62690 RepID=A0A381L0C7_BLUGR|nr:Bgt-20757 [Blumeria graminis f. sp. tritici]